MLDSARIRLAFQSGEGVRLMMAYPFEIRIVEDGFCIYDCPPNWQVNEPGISFHRVYYSHGGFAAYEDEQQRLELQKGKLYIFPTNKPYKIRHDPDHPFRCLWFHIVLSPILLNTVIEYDVGRKPAALHLIESIEAVLDMHLASEHETLIVTELLHSLFYLVSQDKEFKTLNDAYLTKVTDFIHLNYMNEITNEQLSHLSGYNKSYLIRLFKKTFGITPQKYILSHRLVNAIRLIRENRPISEVAGLVGYSDVKAFCRIFRKVKGTPPSEYRKSHFWQP